VLLSSPLTPSFRDGYRQAGIVNRLIGMELDEEIAAGEVKNRVIVSIMRLKMDLTIPL